jgi:hypothetical protein
MIAVQMREQDVMRDCQSFEGDEARSPQVDAEANAKEARVEPSSGTEMSLRSPRTWR